MFLSVHALCTLIQTRINSMEGVRGDTFVMARKLLHGHKLNPEEEVYVCLKACVSHYQKLVLPYLVPSV